MHRKINTIPESNGRWGMYESSIQNYEASFAPLNLRGSLEQLKRRNQSQPLYALDLMGAGQVMRDLKQEEIITAGVSATLTDTRNEASMMDDVSQGLDVIGGDIMTQTPWSKLDRWLRDKGLPGFDLIICRAQGGFEELPHYVSYYEVLFWKAFNLLSPDGGQLFTQVPVCEFETFHDEKKQWLQAVGQLPGVQFESKMCDEYYPHGSLEKYMTFDLMKVVRNQQDFNQDLTYNRHSIFPAKYSTKRG